MKDEYLMLRNEILKDYDIIQNSRYILYVVVATILSFSISRDEPLLFLIPYIVIIPTYLVSIDYTLDMYRISTYLMVFLEHGEFNWENHQYKFNYVISKKIPRRFKFFHFPFLSASIACTLLFALRVKYPVNLKSISIEFCLEEIIAFVLLLIVIFIYYKYKNMPKYQKEYINAWHEVKMCIRSDNINFN